jgi:NAD(P)-dependent dehydrogenase (short-subunit alcohol dehydrogenase family)
MPTGLVPSAGWLPRFTGAPGVGGAVGGRNLRCMQKQQQDTPNPREAGPRPPFPEQKQDHPGHEREMSPRPDHGEQSYQGHGLLQGKVALVTGGDSGIGRAVVLAFAREGADVAIAYLNEDDDARESQRLVEAAGRRVLLLPGDITDDATCAKLVQRTVDELGRLDILVNNAAYQGESVESFEELAPERVKRTLMTNVAGMFFLTRHALPHLKPGSAIINTASINAYHPKSSILDYASTKGAIVTFTKGLGQELAERGIRVNAVAPGPVWTPLVVQSFEGQQNKTFGQSNPMGRPAQPAELAPTFVFLASDASRFITAEVIGVTGGKLLA